LQRDYISYDEMGSNVKKAVIASEDQKFFDHDGFDYTAIEKAMKNNEKGKKIKRRKYHFSADCKKYFSLAGQKLDQKRTGSSLYFHHRKSLE
jgi:phosphoribulokinase